VLPSILDRAHRCLLYISFIQNQTYRFLFFT